jgi:class 3 adenylate cyclase/WD40 repeat protein
VTALTAPTPPPQSLTFVFTDIEGSTRLLEELRDRYADVLAIHGRLIGEAVARAGGELVDTQGDAFFLVFPTVDQAVAFAVDAQRALERERWPTDTRLRVRMGIHSGEATANAGGYVGLDVHRAARISSAAHGGQVLLSQEAVSALGDGSRLKHIGAHQLKDFKAPIELHQLVIDGLPAEFPPPRSYEEPDQPPADGEPPYQGLAHFEEEDAARFFGREKLVARLVARLAEQAFLAVIGASGSGKSSVTRAGLIPALRAKGVGRVVLLTPTAEPFAALAAALLPDAGSAERDELAQRLRFGTNDLAERLGPGSLLVVDQAEELFSLCREEAERAAFIERVLSATTAGGYVVLTLRADFYDRLAGYPDFSQAVAAHQEYLLSMSPAELKRAIEGPARAGGWRFDAGLVDLILHDVGTEPGALPLLSHALLETWQRRRGRLMMLRGYLESGGVQAAIARSADRLMAELGPDQQLIARTIFLRLTEFGAGTPDTRRRAGLTELVGQADGEAAADVLQRLAEHRLVVLGEDTAEVAHEALIREWPTLREWLAADREALRLHRGLTEAATDWQRANREPSLLYRGARLAAALDWAPAHAAELNALERDFLDESRLASEREAHHQRQVNRRLRFLLAGAGVFLVLAIGAGAYAALEAGRAEQEANRAESEAAAALTAQREAETARGEAEGSRQEAEQQAKQAQRERDAAQDERYRAEQAEARAEQEATIARARELTASAINVIGEDPALVKALLLAAARDVAPSLETLELLHWAIAEDRVIGRYAWPAGRQVSAGTWVDLHPSGELMIASPDTDLAVPFTPRRGLDDYMEMVSWPDGTVLWRHELEEDSAKLGPAYFTPDGERVVAGVRWRQADEDPAVAAPPGRLGLYVVGARGGEPIRQLDLGPCGGVVRGASTNHALVSTTELVEEQIDEQVVANLICGWADEKAVRLELVDLSTGERILVAPRAMEAAISVDGRTVAFADWTVDPYSVVVENLETSRRCEILNPADIVRPRIWNLSNDGSLLLYGIEPVTVWGTRDCDRRATFEQRIVSAEFDPTGLSVYSSGWDGQLVQWESLSGRVFDDLVGLGRGRPVASHSGHLLVGGLDTGTAVLADVRLMGELGALDARAGADYWTRAGVTPACFVLQRGLVIGGGIALMLDACSGTHAEHTTIAVDLDSMSMRYSLRGTGGQEVAVSPDGLRFVRQEAHEMSHGSLMVRDLLTGEEIIELDGMCTYNNGAPDLPAHCATYPATPFAIWPSNIRWSPDGSMIAVVDSEGGAVTVWDAITGDILALSVSDPSKGPVSVMFHPSADRLFVSYHEGSVDAFSTVSWELAAQREPTGALSAILGFTPGGQLLVLAPYAGGSGGGSLHWLDPDTLQPVQNPVTREDILVLAADVSPSRSLVATAGAEGILRILDAATGRLEHRVNFGNVPIKGVAFVDDHRVAVGLENGQLHVVTINPIQLLDLARSSLTRTFTRSECERFNFEECPTLEELRAP